MTKLDRRRFSSVFSTYSTKTFTLYRANLLNSTHDQLTNTPGSWETAVEALRLFRRHGLVTAINSVLSEREARDGQLDVLMNLARELDCDYVQLIHPKPAGVWMNRREDMQTDAGLIEALQKEHLRFNGPSKPDYPSLAAQVFEESKAVLGCTAGAVDRFYLNATGEVQPCEFLNLSFGNIREEPFETILARMRSFFPTPALDWLCCTQADAIARIVHENRIVGLPLPWAYTKQLVENWDRGRPTPLYEKLGIYQ